MATALQQQLAAIAANSTHQLDLKAQKVRHSKSLLFDSRDAASQSFDTIFQISYEGFEELCRLDTRFTAFASNLFSEQSKREDRSDMTAAETKELDRKIERFLGLVSGRILLKPAVKAVEWLVRRFRVQEHNTEWLLLTFLPYHASPVFLALLAILPAQLPSSFKFLQPYIAALQNPARHVIVTAAISTPTLFSGLSTYAVRVSRAQHQSAAILGFWASVTAQAVSGLADAAQSGQNVIRREREEDLLLRILPVLQSALSVKTVPELYLGACMIIAILTNKTALEDQVLDAMMEGVVGGWVDQTIGNGLACLAVLAEDKHDPVLPKAVSRAILDSPRVLDLMPSALAGHRASRLIISVVHAASQLGSAEAVDRVDEMMKSYIDDGSFSEPEIRLLAEAIFTASGTTNSTTTHLAVNKFTDSLLGAHQSSHIALEVAQARQIPLDNAHAQLLNGAAATEELTNGKNDDTETDPMELDTAKTLPDITSILAQLPKVPSKASFLDQENDEIYQEYLNAFASVVGSGERAATFLSAGPMSREHCFVRPTYFSFLARTWSTAPTVIAKVKALEAMAEQVTQDTAKNANDLQAIFPYIFSALADPAQKVRRTAAGVCTRVDNCLTRQSESSKPGFSKSFYGPKTDDLAWLKLQDFQKFFQHAIVAHLEDSVLDANHISNSVAETLKGSHSQVVPGIEQKELKSALRTSACTFLAFHATKTPVWLVKLRILTCLHKVGKPASDARKTLLLPFAKEWTTIPTAVMRGRSAAQHIDLLAMDKAVLSSLSHRSTEEVDILKRITKDAYGEREELAVIAVTCLGHLWPAMKYSGQVDIVDYLLEMAIDNTNASKIDAARSEALEVLRSLPFNTEILVHLLENLPNAVELQDQPPSAKKRRTSKSESMEQRPTDLVRLNTSIRKITVVLELLETSKPSQRPELLKGLFHVLGELSHYKILLGSQLVYLQGLTLSCLKRVVDGLKSRADIEFDRSVIRADLIVECVRTTSSNQVHNTALLLVSSLASWAPELVLHSVMPLFTFMSTTLLRQSDEYSAHVTDQTVAQIVPPLAASLKKRGRDLVSGASELLLSFTTAFEHIPLHRRLGLFHHLIDTLGANESLYAVTAMLVERYSAEPGMSLFAVDLMAHFPVPTQLEACNQYLSLVFDGLKPKKGLSEVILGFGDKSADDVEDSLDILLQGLAEILQSEKLRRRVAKSLVKTDEEAKRIRGIYPRLLEQAMQLGRDVKDNDTLKQSSESVLASLLALTPTKDFIESSAVLMQTGSDATRQQVFRSLEARVAEAKRGDMMLQQVYLDVLPNCCIFIRQEQPVLVRHSAITCIDQIVEKYGRRDRTAVLAAAEDVTGEAALRSEDSSLRVISILCLASMVEVLGDEIVPILPAILSTTLDYLEETLGSTFVDQNIHSAAFSFVSAVLDSLPWLFSTQNLDRTLVTVAKSAARGISATPAQFCSLAATQLDATELISAVDRTWSTVVSEGATAVSQHLGLIRQTIEHHKKATISKISPTLFSVLLKAFDLRTDLAPDGNSHDDVYSFVNTIALDMTLKLNDATFRPFFVRMCEWAKAAGSKSRLARFTGVFDFAHTLFEQLKSIVTSYASFLLEDSATLLVKLNAADTEEGSLLITIVEALSSSFRHDQDDFWQAPAHFDAVALPLINQLKRAKDVEYTARIVPAITDLAEAAASPEHHKMMNTAIMKFMKHSSSAVRFAAVKCERSITERLNLDWLALLPEMLPIISELQEDDDEHVERETLRWVKQISEVTGESLEGMLG